MSIRANEQTFEHANRLLPLIPENVRQDVKQAVNAVLDVVLNDEKIARDNETGAIQLFTIRGIIAQQVLELLGFPKENIGVMVIGDTDTPEFMNELTTDVLKRTEKNAQDFVYKYGSGYDIEGQGPIEARESMINYFDRSYGFSESKIPGLVEKFTKNSTIIGGGMQAIEMVTAAINYEGVNKRRKGYPNPPKTRFNHADATFAMALEIVERVLVNESSEMNSCPAQQKNLLHLSPEEIDEFYSKNGSENVRDIWYLLPVGNPSSTADSKENLAETCRTVIKHNPNTVIMLDCAYVRTMSHERSKNQLSEVMNDENILNRVVFIDSFSKTHGYCGFRSGTYFAYNDELFKQILGYDRTLGQGHGIGNAAFVKAVCDTDEELEKRTVDKLKEFWGLERFGLYNFLMDPKNGFSHLFDGNQSHLNSEQIKNLTSIYLTLKIADGVDVAQIAGETGCLGFPCKEFGSGKYVRFTVSTLKESAFAKYADVA